MSEAPRVGPDRTAAIDFLEECCSHLPPSEREEYRKALAALAASGAGPTEPSERAIDAAVEKSEHQSELGMAPRRMMPSKVRTMLRAAYQVDSLRANSREQEPASDRYVTPQPVDAPDALSPLDNFGASLKVSGRTSRNVIAKASVPAGAAPETERLRAAAKAIVDEYGHGPKAGRPDYVVVVSCDKIEALRAALGSEHPQ